MSRAVVGVLGSVKSNGSVGVLRSAESKGLVESEKFFCWVEECKSRRDQRSRWD